MPLHHVKKRGFASMTMAERQRIASLGGKKAHEIGTAHEWNKEEAKAAGRKGGSTKRKVKIGRNRPEKDNQDPKPAA